MEDAWKDFIVGFCKVDIVCWHGEPNWLGWLILGVGAIVIVLVALQVWLSRL